jgi:TatD DNase family protein
MIDTHIHLNHVKMKNVDQVIENGINAGVQKFVVVGFDLPSSKSAIQLSEKYSCVYAAIGCHPVDYKSFDNEFKMWLIENINHPKVVALGEIGLDYYWIKDEIEQKAQLTVFNEQLDIAKEMKIPIMIHSRESNEDVIDTILNQEYVGQVIGIMHSFSGTPQQAKAIIDNGYYIGIGGVITYKNGQSMQQTVKELGVDQVVIETDGPFLTPDPFRREMNESKYLPLIVDKIAQLTNLEQTDVIKITTKNAYKILPKLGE